MTNLMTKNSKIKRITLNILILLCSASVSGCYPLIFGGAAATGIAVSEDRTIGKVIDDKVLWAKIEQAFLNKGFKNLFTKIDVLVHEGRVLMVGYLEHHEHLTKAIDIAWSVPGVTEVINELAVSPEQAKADHKRYAKDSFISGQVKAQAFMDKKIKYSNYHFFTFDSKVYVFGKARSKAELDRVTAIASRVDGVKKVISYAKVEA